MTEQLARGAAQAGESLGALALDAAQAGAEAIARVARTGRLGVQVKGERYDLVTDADRASEKAIIAAIHRRRPNDQITAEESGDHPGSSGVRWLVDPLDGTTNFVHGREQYAVSVAAIEAGRPVAGALCLPSANAWVAADGSVASGNAGRPRVARDRELGEALLSIGCPHSSYLRPRALALTGELLPEIRDFRRIGSPACDLFAVATGALDAYIGFGLQAWDVAGGWAVVHAAGGVCTQLMTAGGLDAFVAGTPLVVEALESWLSRH